MKFWLSKTGDVSLREQLAAQIILGIVSRDLAPGQRLPSTREMGRRHSIHANTVSAAYRNLAERGWVEFRAGSGIYVRPEAPESEMDQAPGLDQIVTSFLQQARAVGFSDDQIRAGIAQALAAPAPDHFLVLEPDPGLREILVEELATATGVEVHGAHPAKLGAKALLRAVPVALIDEVPAVRQHLPPNAECIGLRLTSVPATLIGAKRPEPESILAVISKWPEFLVWSRTMLLAAGIDPAAIITCDRRRPNWQRGLKSAELLICDIVTARQWKDDSRVRTFRVVAQSSLDELVSIAGKFPFAGAKRDAPIV
jgi:DNA-binding transcriptional regulator YhcF (GntR family)